MTEAAALELRHVRLAEPVTLRPASLGATPEEAGEEGVFVALDDSPPVRTVLAVVDESGRRRALEVAWVVEVAERDEVRGFYGRWLADEALERAARVGTEHLEDGTPVVQPVVHDNSAVLDVSDTAMAMPAPVIVVDDDTGVVDTEDEDEGEPAAASGPEGSADAAIEAAAGEAAAGEAAASEAAAGEAAASEAAAGETAAGEAAAGEAATPAEAQVEASEPQAEPGQTDGSGERNPDDVAAASETANEPAIESRGESAESSTEAGEASSESAESSTEAGEASSESAESSTEAGEASAEASTDSGEAAAPAKGGRKKRGRKRR